MSEYGEKQVPYLWLEHGKIDSYSSAEHFFFFFKYFDKQNRVCNFSSNYADTQGGGYDFDDLVIRAQYDRQDKNGWGLYGWGVEYRTVHYVGLEHARQMVKTLNRVEKGLERLEKKWGPPQSFSQYVIRVADIFKVEGILRKVDGKERMMTGQSHVMHEVSDASYAIGRLLNEYGYATKEMIYNA